MIPVRTKQLQAESKPLVPIRVKTCTCQNRYAPDRYAPNRYAPNRYIPKRYMPKRFTPYRYAARQRQHRGHTAMRISWRAFRCE